MRCYERLLHMSYFVSKLFFFKNCLLQVLSKLTVRLSNSMALIPGGNLVCECLFNKIGFFLSCSTDTQHLVGGTLVYCEQDICGEKGKNLRVVMVFFMYFITYRRSETLEPNFKMP